VYEILFPYKTFQKTIFLIKKAIASSRTAGLTLGTAKIGQKWPIIVK
jgi:hypothetical protein